MIRLPMAWSPSAAAVLLALLAAASGCTAAKVVATPLTVVRDVVDVPLVSLTNVFEFWAEGSSKTPTPNVGVGAGPGGVFPVFGINLGYYFFKPLSWLFGGVDYLVCRSLWPNWPWGISPWKAPGNSVGSLYFPSTRTLWDGDPAVLQQTDDEVDEDVVPGEPAPRRDPDPIAEPTGS